jgi:hypothetical protein
MTEDRGQRTDGSRVGLCADLWQAGTEDRPANFIFEVSGVRSKKIGLRAED